MVFWPHLGPRATRHVLRIPMIVLALGIPAAALSADDRDQSPTAETNQENPLLKGLEGHRDGLPKGDNECVFFRSIYDWRAIDRYNLILWAPSRRSPYRVQLNRSCDGLRYTDTIAFSSNLDGRLCAFGGDAVVVDHDRCPIGAITKLTQEELDFLLAYKPGQDPSGDDADKKDKKDKKKKKKDKKDGKDDD